MKSNDPSREAGSAPPDLPPAQENSPYALNRRAFIGTASAALAGLGLAACTSSAGEASTTSAAAGATTTAAGVSSSTAASGGSTNDILGLGPRKVVWAIAAIADWNLPIDVGFVEAASYLGWEYEKQGVPLAQYTPEEVVNVVERGILSGPDVLVTSGWEEGLYAPLRDAKEDGMIVLLNDANNFPDLAREYGIPWVGSNERDSGYGLASPLLAAAVANGRDSGTVLTGNPFPGNANLEERIVGLREGIEDFNGSEGTSFTTEVLNDESGSDQAQSVTLYNAKFTELGDELAALMAVGGLVGVQAQQRALEERGSEPGEVPIGSINVDADTFDLVREGWVTAVVDTQIYQMGFLPPFLAAQQVGRGYTAANYLTTALVVTAETVDDAAARQAVLDGKAEEYDIVLS